MILVTVPDGSQRPFAGRIFKDTIDAQKFIMFLFTSILAGHLTQGNWLILDNAALHFTVETYEIMMAMLTGAGVRVRFLPTYSPEFNPCELIFGLIKNYIRNNTNSGTEFRHRKFLEIKNNIYCDNTLLSSSLASSIRKDPHGRLAGRR